MDRDTSNISTDYQPKGAGRNPSDTLDRDLAVDGAEPESAPGTRPAAPVVDEKGRPLSGDGKTGDAAR